MKSLIFDGLHSNKHPNSKFRGGGSKVQTNYFKSYSTHLEQMLLLAIFSFVSSSTRKLVVAEISTERR